MTIFSFMSVGWGQCVDGVEVELWGECYNIEETTSLDLSNSGLTGEIPNEIGNLINLTGFNFNHNNLSGNIPIEVWEMTNLDFISLWGNQFTGVIPEQIENLTNLVYLNLEQNNFSGNFPELICDMNLTSIYLDGNQFCSPYPSCLNQGNVGSQDTSNCEEPSLCDEEIEVELWGECYNIQETTDLNLYNNELTGEIPSEIGNLTNLDKLLKKNILELK